MQNLRSILAFLQETSEKREDDKVKAIKLENMSFKLKLTLSYLLLVLLPIIIVGVFSYNIALETLKRHAKDNISLTIEQINDNVDYKLASVKSISDYIYNDLMFQQILSKGYSDYEGVELQKYLINYMVPIVNLPVIRNRLYLYLNNTTVPETYTISETDLLLRGKGYDIYHINSVKPYTWYRKLEKLDNRTEWLQVEKDFEFNNISLLKKLYNLDDVLKFGTDKSHLGYIRISVKLKDLFDTEQFHRVGNEKFFIVRNSKNQIIYSDPPSSSEEFVKLINTKKYIEIKNHIPKLDSELIVLVPLDQLEHSAKRVRKMSIIICFASLVVFTLVSLLISKHFSQKVSRIVSFINSFRDGEFNKQLKTSSNDELHQISTAMNEMAGTINTLIEEIYITNIRKATAELQVLQSQINPHFLYNTLASVSTLAQLGKIDKLNDVIDGLVSFYRLTLNKGSFIIDIDKEIQQVKAYIDIKKTQYGDRLNVHYDIEPSILEYKTIKIILQPFVENSLEHGMYMGRKINVRLLAYMEGNNIIFKIIDDGLGMDPEFVKQLLNPEEHSIGYGIRNVNERIKLQFGKEYGLNIFSRPGIGTTVSIVIPACKKIV
jgi:two-component system, sensor histidine kinase YesM